MKLSEPILQSYRTQYRELRATVGSSLRSLLCSFGGLDDKLWLILNRVLNWRERYNDSLLEVDRLVAAYSGVRTDPQNDGFHQYFAKSSGEFWPDLQKLLQLGGDTDGEAHFRRVLAHFSKKLSGSYR